MGNLLLGLDDAPAVKTELERSSAISGRKFAVAIGHGRNSEQFLYVGGMCGRSRLGPPIFPERTVLLVSEFRSLLLIFLAGAFVSVRVMAGRPTGKSTKLCPRPIVAWAPLWIVE